MKENPTIWLSYVSYPVTTAVFFERALRKQYKVVTIGPNLPEGLIKQWNLENMKLPVKDHNVVSEFVLDMKQALEVIHKDHHPDLYLWIESVSGFFPVNLDKLKCPTACYLIDSHIHLETHINYARHFDFTFIAQREYVPQFKQAGIANVYWLPLGCDTEIHSKKPGTKVFDVGFAGSVSGMEHGRRRTLLEKIKSSYNCGFNRVFWDEMSELFSQSKIVFNNAIRDDLNMRLFEAMSTGSFLITDLAKNSGQQEMFVDGEDYGLYEDNNIIEKVKFYLENENIREKIAANGQRIVHNAHTYSHRCAEILNVVSGKRIDTPSAEEWRDRSLSRLSNNIPADIKLQDNKQNIKSNRSFVIPVLDMSPASPYNITTLLNDLEKIPGEVIVVFNSLEMAEKLKDHPRINYYAAMKYNVGVARAWNIGLNISSTPVTFILNSDLHITGDTVDILEKSLCQLPQAAIVGPQGSFFNFELAKDLQYFNKGSFSTPIEVDAVSGFLFAVRTEYFNSGTLKFDNQYTPCFFEEWDTGLQCKLAKLKSYIAPVTGYDHEWSGSIRALRKIKYLDKEETAGEILERNRKLFWIKWNKIKEQENRSILQSIWVKRNLQYANNLIEKNIIPEAEKVLKCILEFYPEELETLAMLGKILYRQNLFEESLVYFNKISEINPDCKLQI